MANNWLVDNCFPTFTGQESTKQMIQALVDYMRQLTDQLRYSLENLDSTNWNDGALKQIGDQMTSQISDEVNKLLALTNRMSAVISSLESEFLEDSRRIRSLEECVSEVEYTMQSHEERIESLESGMENMQILFVDLMESVQNMSDAVTMLNGAIEADVEGVTIGAAGQRVELVGNVSVNGAAL